MLTEMKNGRKRTVISQQIMTLRIQRVAKLREAYLSTVQLIKENDKLPEAVKAVLQTAQNAAYLELDKAERKVIVQVQKKFSGYDIAVKLFESNENAWPDDPTLTVLPEKDAEDSEDDEKEGDENAE